MIKLLLLPLLLLSGCAINKYECFLREGDDVVVWTLHSDLTATFDKDGSIIIKAVPKGYE